MRACRIQCKLCCLTTPVSSFSARELCRYDAGSRREHSYAMMLQCSNHVKHLRWSGKKLSSAGLKGVVVSTFQALKQRSWQARLPSQSKVITDWSDESSVNSSQSDGWPTPFLRWVWSVTVSVILSTCQLKRRFQLIVTPRNVGDGLAVSRSLPISSVRIFL